jgi:hypothetical protein
MPTYNCARDGINPVVNSVDSASITPGTNATAIVAISGHVTAWGCTHAFGSAIKTTIASDSVSISAPLAIEVIDQQQIGLKLAGPVSVMTGHAIAAEVAQLLSGDIDTSLAAVLADAPNASEARAKMPQLAGLKVTVEDAAFAASGNDLLVRVRGTAHMGSAAFNTLLGFLSK